MINKFLYLFLSFTWGLTLTLVGCIVSIVLMIAGYKPKRFLYGWYFEMNTNGSAFNMGPVSIVPNNPSKYILSHEFGHSIQNCFFGQFMIFLVVIPSVIRFWYREYLVRVKNHQYRYLPDYDSIWFEGMATKLGEKYFEYLGDNNEQD